MIIILLHILASDAGPRKKIKINPLWEKSGSEIPRTGKKLIFFLFGHLEGRLIRAPTNNNFFCIQVQGVKKSWLEH
jgi:hypothetical protein